MNITDILHKLALPTNSKKKGFQNTEKLNAIKTLLEEADSPYQLLCENAQAWIFGKKNPEQGVPSILVSSHADIVDSIKNPYSKYMEEEKYYKGTYDNLGTNAACVYLMLHADIPDNIYFAFTADEETGRCNGAEFALAYMKYHTKKEPLIFALDVTEEGYDNDRLFTIEGLHAKTEKVRRQILQVFMDTEGEEQSFEVVRLKKKDDNSFLPKSYQAKDTSEYDESAYYAKRNCNSFSLCLPGEGYMHSNTGFYIKEAVMKGYILCLEAGLIAFSSKDISRIERIKKEKDLLVKDAKETAFHTITAYNNSYYHDSFSCFSQNDNQIPGQMSLSDYDVSFDMNDGNWSNNDPFLLDELLADFYEAASYYNKNQFDMYYSDMCNAYGLKKEAELKKYLFEIFQESHYDYDENEDEYEYE